MDYNEYQRLAVRTAKKFDTANEDKLYYGLGLNGEAGEVAAAVEHGLLAMMTGTASEPNVRTMMSGELGDVMWYNARLADLFDIAYQDVVDASVPLSDPPKLDKNGPLALWFSNALNAKTGKAGEIVKKLVRDKRPLDRAKLTAALTEVHSHLRKLAVIHNLVLDEIAGENIKKLEARYPSNAFDAKDAVARKDGEELRE